MEYVFAEFIAVFVAPFMLNLWVVSGLIAAEQMQALEDVPYLVNWLVEKPVDKIFFMWLLLNIATEAIWLLSNWTERILLEGVYVSYTKSRSRMWVRFPTDWSSNFSSRQTSRIRHTRDAWLRAAATHHASILPRSSVKTLNAWHPNELMNCILMPYFSICRWFNHLFYDRRRGHDSWMRRCSAIDVSLLI